MSKKEPAHLPQLVDLDPKIKAPSEEELDYPHFYRPQHIAQCAAEDLQNRLEQSLPFLRKESKGRMMGVLVVQKKDGQYAYLSAYSGEWQREMEHLQFVPPVYQLPKGDDFPEMAAINALGKEIKSLETSTKYQSLQEHYQIIQTTSRENIRQAKAEAKIAKEKRDALRVGAVNMDENKASKLLTELKDQSTRAGMDLRRFTRGENLKIEAAHNELVAFEDSISRLKTKRRQQSNALQEAIFKAYLFRNSLGESKDVRKVFADFGVDNPPAGAGECAAPKLFQFAFLHNLKPIALAEFWWGPSPRSEVREHGSYYPACKRKCEPILAFMLQGLKVKPNPRLKNLGQKQTLEIVYQDEQLLVINKPAGLLSVPGKYVTDSVETRIRESFPNATGPLIVHRLDQDTSGLMILCLHKEVHKNLQQQFLARSIKKTYYALLDKVLAKDEGQIDLPLILDVNRRPMQMVHFEMGKKALTQYQVLDNEGQRTLIKLHPLTGRSHQLRVHCAHHLGLHAPMVGDSLYGKPADRLYLHAAKIEFNHPLSGERMVVECKVPFLSPS